MLHGTLAVSQVGALAGMLGSVLDLLNFRASCTRPILLALALLSWMVPLASILPPATLSVQSTTTTEHGQLRIPIPRFDGESMAHLNEYLMGPTVSTTELGTELVGESQQTSEYVRPARQLARLVTATAYRGAVPDHLTMIPNSTYTLDFPAPAIKCQAMPEDLLQSFNDAMNCTFISDGSDDEPKTECENVITYLSWVPGKEPSEESSSMDDEYLIPFRQNSLASGILPFGFQQALDQYDRRYIGGITGGPVLVYIATRSQRLPYDSDNWDLLNCTMYNGSYSVTTTSDSNSRGTLSKPAIRPLNSVPFEVSATVRTMNTPLLTNDSTTIAYLALMDSFNRLVVGTIFGNKYSRIRDTSYYSEVTLRVQNQDFKQTLLPFTADLLPFLGLSYELVTKSDYVASPPDPKQWKTAETIDGNLTVSYPIEAFSASTFNRSLDSVLEELFQNMTLSLFSTQAFLEDSPEDIEVEYNIAQNTYAYDSRNLFISYGLAVSFALVAGVAGCVSICCNSASYSNRFSTVLRTTRGQELEGVVAHNDRTGIDPLPRYLAKTRIDLRRGQVEVERDVDAWRPETSSEQTAMIGVSQCDSQGNASSEQVSEPIDQAPASMTRFHTL